MEIIAELRKELENNSSQEVRESAVKFFKEPITLYGINAAEVSKIARKYFDLLVDKSKKNVLALCEELLSSDYFEEASVAFDWAERMQKQFTPSDFEIFERWIEKYIDNWAKCDTFCNHTVASFIEMYPQYANELKKWASSKNRWLRRAAAVTLVLPARRGIFMDEVYKIADILLEDEDDMVQKGYGWMLKEASKSHLRGIFNYVMRNKAKMPRTALRCAIEKMPPEMKEQAMGS